MCDGYAYPHVMQQYVRYGNISMLYKISCFFRCIWLYDEEYQLSLSSLRTRSERG